MTVPEWVLAAPLTRVCDAPENLFGISETRLDLRDNLRISSGGWHITSRYRIRNQGDEDVNIIGSQLMRALELGKCLPYLAAVVEGDRVDVGIAHVLRCQTRRPI